MDRVSRPGVIERVYSALMHRDPDAERALPAAVRADVPRNGLRLVTAQGLQSSGDQTVNASTVLPWLFHALGVPTALVGLLVPIREAGSMLPQAALTPLVLRVRHRKWVFVTGALVQAAAVTTMTAVAVLGSGLVAGVLVIAALAVFSFGRCLTSISSKDVQGRTVPKGQRGQINGLATTASGLVAITLGLGIRQFGGDDLSAGQLAWLLGAGAVMWLGVAVVYAGIREPDGDPALGRADSRADDTAQDRRNWFTDTVAMLRDDRPFRGFVLARSLLLASALSPPFVVSLALTQGVDAISGLGGFVIASGLAALLGGRIFGRWADRSSRQLMSVGAAGSAVVIGALVLAARTGALDGGGAWAGGAFVAAYFSLTLLHTGVRVGRKTYVVDMAEGDQRTRYVAVSNSAMGLILLGVGGISSLLAMLGVLWALVFLAGVAVAGVVASARLPEVSRS